MLDSTAIAYKAVFTHNCFTIIWELCKCTVLGHWIRSLEALADTDTELDIWARHSIAYSGTRTMIKRSLSAHRNEADKLTTVRTPSVTTCKGRLFHCSIALLGHSSTCADKQSNNAVCIVSSVAGHSRRLAVCTRLDPHYTELRSADGHRLPQ